MIGISFSVMMVQPKTMAYPHLSRIARFFLERYFIYFHSNLLIIKGIQEEFGIIKDIVAIMSEGKCIEFILLIPITYRISH